MCGILCTATSGEPNKDQRYSCIPITKRDELSSTRQREGPGNLTILAVRVFNLPSDQTQQNCKIDDFIAGHSLASQGVATPAIKALF